MGLANYTDHGREDRPRKLIMKMKAAGARPIRPKEGSTPGQQKMSPGRGLVGGRALFYLAPALRQGR